MTRRTDTYHRIIQIDKKVTENKRKENKMVHRTRSRLVELHVGSLRAENMLNEDKRKNKTFEQAMTAYFHKSLGLKKQSYINDLIRDLFLLDTWPRTETSIGIG